MKIERFVGRSLNGYLDFDIKFFDKLTFVTGINGCGKTSVLNSIAALLLPRLDYLASQNFEEISIMIAQDSKLVNLKAVKKESKTELSCTLHPEETFLFSEFNEIEPVSPGRFLEHEQEYYRELLGRHSDNLILSYIESLPAPMYLGLDRRALTLDRDRRPYRGRPSTPNRRVRNIFGRSLDVSLREAMSFARDRMQEDRRKLSDLDAEYRETMVLELVDIPPISIPSKPKKPSKRDLKKFDETKTNLNRLPSLLSVSSNRISENIAPVLNFLDETLEKLNKEDSSVKQELALYEWAFNRTNIDKLSKLSDIVAEYNDRASKVQGRINEYLDTVNRFMQDSGKKIVFSKYGELCFILDEDKKSGRELERRIDTLSSGEIQLIVIFTHLYFNPEVKNANVFVIDEPELSLHVQWQEKFVEGIMESSKVTQFILATHSPTIILDKIDNCVDLSKL